MFIRVAAHEGEAGCIERYEESEGKVLFILRQPSRLDILTHVGDVAEGGPSRSSAAIGEKLGQLAEKIKGNSSLIPHTITRSEGRAPALSPHCSRSLPRRPGTQKSCSHAHFTRLPVRSAASDDNTLDQGKPEMAHFPPNRCRCPRTGCTPPAQRTWPPSSRRSGRRSSCSGFEPC